MGTWLIFQGLAVVTKAEVRTSLSDWTCGGGLPGNSPANKTVPQTDTGGQVENTKASELTLVKELGKMAP